MLVEIIVTNVEEAIFAEKYGADRLELIHGFEFGGLSPSLDMAKKVCDAVNIPVNVMVRPHGQGFVLAQHHMNLVLSEIDFLLNNTSFNAIVFGSLTEEGYINFKQLEMVSLALEGSGKEITFHRAIDVSIDPLNSLASLIDFNSKFKQVSRILTSGGKDTALSGLDTITKMQDMVKETGIKILAGSGINPNNVKKVITTTKVSEIHLGTGVRTNDKLDKKLFKQLFNTINT